jgi:purine nucleoside permease
VAIAALGLGRLFGGNQRVASYRKTAEPSAANVLPIVRQIQAAGATTFRAIAIFEPLSTFDLLLPK